MCGVPIYISTHLQIIANHLVKLGLCTPTPTVTRIGLACLAGDMEINSILLVKVGKILGVEAYAMVAAAFILSLIHISEPTRQP